VAFRLLPAELPAPLSRRAGLPTAVGVEPAAQGSKLPLELVKLLAQTLPLEIAVGYGGRRASVEAQAHLVGAQRREKRLEVSLEFAVASEAFDGEHCISGRLRYVQATSGAPGGPRKT
jgi:hypothetical protein